VVCQDYVNSREEGNREESGMAKKKGDNAVTTWFRDDVQSVLQCCRSWNRDFVLKVCDCVTV
jgi:hypothetical protein